jgi:hypothetical protein
MGYIYRSAHLTIIAAGRGPERAGLRGLDSRTARRNPEIVRLGKIALLSATEPISGVEQRFPTSPVWDRRGWTLQESILSHRRLVFSEEQVYWECQSSTWWEEVHFESDNFTIEIVRDVLPFLSTELSLKTLLSPHHETFFQAFRILSSGYGLRKLSNNLDRFDAMRGLLCAIFEAHPERTWRWGLLMVDFEVQLCWTLESDVSWAYAIGPIEITSPRGAGARRSRGFGRCRHPGPGCPGWGR